MGVMFGVAERIDRLLQQRLGLPYLKATRDFAIHERCTFLTEVLDRLEPVAEGRRVLDVGCGSGMALRYLARRRDIASYVGVDLNAGRLIARYDDVALPHRFADADVDGEWRPEGGFDVVWTAEVLEHLIDDVGVLRRLAAGMRPGGAVILTVPSLAFVRRVGAVVPSLAKVSPVQDGGHVRLGYGPDDLRALAEAAGLRVEALAGISPSGVGRAERRYAQGGAVRILGNLRLAAGGMKRAVAWGPALSGREDRFESLGAVLRAGYSGTRSQP